MNTPHNMQDPEISGEAESTAEVHPLTSAEWSTFFNWIAVCIGPCAVLVAHFKLHKHGLDAAAIGLIAMVVTKISLEVLAFLWRWRRAFLALAGTLGIALAASVAGNPHCLEPESHGDEEEQVICLYVSTFAPSLAQSISIEVGLVPSGASGQRSPGIDATGFNWPSVVSSNVLSAAPYDGRGENPSELISLDPLEQRRFNTCLSSLYEDPALKIQAWAMRTQRLDEGDAHDVVMDRLFAVCENYMKAQISDLVPYYAKAVRNALSTYHKNARRFTSCESLIEQPATCLPDRLLLMSGEAQWLERALCSLEVRERMVLERWKQGGSWREIGQDLGLGEAQAANLYNGTLRKLTQRIDEQRCKTPSRY